MIGQLKEMYSLQPRSYQLRLVDHITRQNGIIYLPTGSGKTFVAILALKRFSQDMDKCVHIQYVSHRISFFNFVYLQQDY